MKSGKILGLTLAIGMMVVGAGSAFANETNTEETAKSKSGDSIIVEGNNVSFDNTNGEFLNSVEAIPVTEYSSEELDELFKDMKPGETKTLEDGSVIGVVDVVNSSEGSFEINLEDRTETK